MLMSRVPPSVDITLPKRFDSNTSTVTVRQESMSAARVLRGQRQGRYITL